MTTKIVLGEHPQHLVVRLTKGDSASLIATATDSDGQPVNWTAAPVLEFATVSRAAISAYTAVVSGSTATWSMTRAQIDAIWTATHPHPTLVRLTVPDATDEVDGRSVEYVGKVSWSDGWSASERVTRISVTTANAGSGYTVDPAYAGLTLHFGPTPLPDPTTMPNTVYIALPPPA